jgi:phosphoribosylanthranilate isomerase
MFIKICGITRIPDALHAAQAGATALGFMFWPRSPRYVEPARAAEIIAALPPHVVAVGVFVNEPVDRIRAIVEETGISTIQLHGDEQPADAGALGWPVLRAMIVERADEMTAAWPADTTFLIDAADPVRRGGTGMRADWERAASIAQTRRVVLAGGLTESNVATAIATVRPFGVDVSSGVEEQPGVKDSDKVARFIASARSAFEQHEIGHR